ncbi:unnamed protein product [Rangifer tarandus platyrhynchus]|uniref:Uncharacterized protein n=1 Tax=Rangifer tarandus platyrhynchus TaxID=3082113 RepID=A0AC59Y9K8_RANTA
MLVSPTKSDSGLTEMPSPAETGRKSRGCRDKAIAESRWPRLKAGRTWAAHLSYLLMLEAVWSCDCRAAPVGHGTALPQSSPQLVQAALGVVRPFQSLLPLRHPMSVSGAGLFSSQTLGTCCGLAGGLPAEMGVEEQM